MVEDKEVDFQGCEIKTNCEGKKSPQIAQEGTTSIRRSLLDHVLD
jgi:hypothetical protein